MSFGEETAAAPTVVSHTSDKVHPTVLRIDGEQKQLRVEFTRGEGSGAAYAARYSDNVTVANQPDDEDGDPQPQEWNIFIGGTQIADWVAGPGAGSTNGEVLKKLAVYILGEKGVI